MGLTNTRPAGSLDVIARIPGGSLRHVRSTLLCSSIAELRARGLFDAYVRHLAPSLVDVLVPGATSTWLPLAVAQGHYEACDRLGLNPEEAVAFGAASAHRVQHAFLKTFLVIARGAGATPLDALARYPRLWGRQFEGGDVTITRVGPKDVTVDFREFPLSAVPFFRHAFRGGNEGALRLFARTVYVRETRWSPTTISLRMSWV